MEPQTTDQKLTDEEIHDMFVKMQLMEAKNKDLEQQLDLVLIAKQNLEKTLVKERKQIKEPQDKTEDIGKFSSEILFLIKQIQMEREKVIHHQCKNEELTEELGKHKC